MKDVSYDIHDSVYNKCKDAEINRMYSFIDTTFINNDIEYIIRNIVLNEDKI